MWEGDHLQRYKETRSVLVLLCQRHFWRRVSLCRCRIDLGADIDTDISTDTDKETETYMKTGTDTKETITRVDRVISAISVLTSIDMTAHHISPSSSFAIPHRNGLIGADYSSKFSPWLSHGCITAAQVYGQCKKYERERVENTSTYWLVFELLWR